MEWASKKGKIKEKKGKREGKEGIQVLLVQIVNYRLLIQVTSIIPILSMGTAPNLNAIHPATFDTCHMIYTQGQIIVQVEIIIVDRFLLPTINSVIQSLINLNASDESR